MATGKNSSAISSADHSKAARITPSAAAGFTADAEKLQNDPWGWWREQMPITDQWAYFDHAAVAPLSGPATEAIKRWGDQAACQGDTVWPQWSASLGRLRDATAVLLNCALAEICLIPNTTTGINIVAEGFPWQSGDNVILPDGEFPSNLFPWMNQQSKGVEVRMIPRRSATNGCGEVHVDDLIDAIDDSTRIIAVSWVGYSSGFRLDIDDLVRRAHEKGVLVFLDAIQGLGVFPLDLAQTPVDFLAADGHKWLLGPEGAGVAMIRRQHLELLRCTNVGWGSVKNSANFNAPTFALRDDATRFEPGSANMVGGTALAASMEIFLQIRRVHGNDAIQNQVVELIKSLDSQLRSLGATTELPTLTHQRSGILNFSVPGIDPSTFRERGLQKNVVTSCRGKGVRASVHAYNNDDDIARLVEVARSFC
ncbi:aminotransferase class V-fold PLP-dependent enzyme [Rubripirellula reticaptiva]|uniref:Cysteine desulfurase n=1 Tax=Rubripirellula reticaptiva TaxID=2528013 RepID=A0A5C6ENJ0_9BACT|nr:aminotransferase class V-fold PLP-dependent enzyme [Rubripirellula reticaptiva]TWU51313.1 Cysteine desulfurase [Rubripirellula reticaptiva]